ncbi:MAG: type II secretion system protein [Planctomycetota bacterium]|nr:MAG: type II secretion system protein [Planctomycetota bacterium]
MSAALRLPARRRRGFTLLEMLVVIMIIGILSTFLVTNVPDFLDRANMTASEKNMQEVYAHMLSYRSDHSNSFPKDGGCKFLLRVWKDGYMEKTEKNAKRFFSPKMPYGEWVDPEVTESMDIVEYLSQDWDTIGPGYISYAGFDTGGDRDIRRQLNKNPGKTTIMADAEIFHRTAIIYLTGDGATHRLMRSEIEDRTGMDLDVDEPTIGPGSELEELATVSND